MLVEEIKSQELIAAFGAFTQHPRCQGDFVKNLIQTMSLLCCSKFPNGSGCTYIEIQSAYNNLHEVASRSPKLSPLLTMLFPIISQTGFYLQAFALVVPSAGNTLPQIRTWLVPSLGSGLSLNLTS